MIYLDNAATTPVNPEVAKVIYESMLTTFANPSSLYDIGAESEKQMNTARRTVASCINAKAITEPFTAWLWQDRLGVKNL